MTDPKGRQSIPFDRIEPGMELGTFAYEVTPELVDRHRRATEQEPYPDASLAPVSMLAADGVNLADQFWDISQSVHAGQRLEVVRLPRIGDRLSVAGTAREKFTKRGRRYIVSDIETINQRGQLVAHGVTTGVIVYAEGEGGPGQQRAEPAGESRVLERLGPLVRTMTLEAMTLYEPPGEVNIHTSDAVARAAGLPAAIATGTLFLAYVFDLLYRTYGLDCVVGTDLDVRIRVPVFAGDRVETRAEVISHDVGRIEHLVRCTTPLGDAIVGRASVPEK